MKSIGSEVGDTLIEVIMSIAILGLALLTAFNVASLSFKNSVQARERTQAVYLAQQQAEILRLDRDRLAKSGAFLDGSLCPALSECWLSISSGNIIVNSGRSTFSYTDLGVLYQVFIVPQAVDDKLAKVQIITEWRKVGGEELNRSVINYTLSNSTKIKPPQACNEAGQPGCGAG